jgi:uncharacterized protein YpbB
MNPVKIQYKEFQTVSLETANTELILTHTRFYTKLVCLLKKIEWVIDYYFVYMLYSDNKLSDYEDFMTQKWGKKPRNIDCQV